MNFPKVDLPGVTEAERAEVARLIEKDKHETEVMQHNKEGMLLALLRLNKFGHGKGKRKKR